MSRQRHSFAIIVIVVVIIIIIKCDDKKYLNLTVNCMLLYRSFYLRTRTREIAKAEDSIF